MVGINFKVKFLHTYRKGTLYMFEELDFEKSNPNFVSAATQYQ